ncbi:phasin family protein [Methylobacterium isbiliense]|jgi:hypothetical protein|uniref:Phasin domain-containing protein n=1 Tax=Methylobacterium isbiliense TaxID=315478 RepID=A0ABQ4SA16_9HYPH|nr:phasin family protein [Methylobacterium isbiliense]MDN3623509.1 phasin family protein [Methylobacterium isbiliense]GJD99232.1 hypothetical protein GMJLKIPL_1148 [Methylobacterium isbiliense]
MAFETRSGKDAGTAFDISSILASETALWKSFGFDLPLRVTAELLSFGSRRLEAQAEHVRALGRCGSPAEVMKSQTAFLTRAIADYQREAETLSRDLADAAPPALRTSA